MTDDDLTFLYWAETDVESTIMDEWWALDSLLYECAYLEYLVYGNERT